MNILLDKNTQPEIAISDCFFLEEKIYLTTRVGGTVGYMTPKYVI
jgi:hypothetical protein